MDLNEAPIELHRQAIQLSLTCPISRGIYNDPVLIQQSGHVVDRKSLCEWLLQNPTRCPVTNVDFGKKLQYCDCHFSKSRLILYEENEYKRYDDSEFQRQYEALQIVPRESKEKKLGARLSPEMHSRWTRRGFPPRRWKFVFRRLFYMPRRKPGVTI